MKEKILDYLENNMSPNERQVFERTLESDPNLQTELLYQQDLIESLQKAHQRQQFQEKFKHWQAGAAQIEAQRSKQSWLQEWFVRLKKQFTTVIDGAQEGLTMNNGFELEPQFRGQNDSSPNIQLPDEDFNHLKTDKSHLAWWIYAGIAGGIAILLYFVWQFFQSKN